MTVSPRVRVPGSWLYVPGSGSRFVRTNPESERRTGILEPRTENPEPFLYFRRLANHLLERPPLPAAHRPRFDDRDGIADLRSALFVVDHELRRPSLGLAIQAVPHLPLHGDDDALLHLVADDGGDFL